jgi:hypothetical protein
MAMAWHWFGIGEGSAGRIISTHALILGLGFDSVDVFVFVDALVRQYYRCQPAKSVWSVDEAVCEP